MRLLKLKTLSRGGDAPPMQFYNLADGGRLWCARKEEEAAGDFENPLSLCNARLPIRDRGAKRVRFGTVAQGLGGS